MKVSCTLSHGLAIRWIAVISVLAGAIPAHGFRKFNADPASLVAVGGYDVVAYLDEGKAVRGAPIFFVEWEGVYWRFKTKANQRKFEANPEKYSPEFGGYCAVGIANGKLAGCDPRLFAIHEGRIYVFGDRDQLNLWKRNPGKYIRDGRIFYEQLVADLESAAEDRS